MYDIITVGSATVDVFSKTEADVIKVKDHNSTHQLIAYPCGSKILMNSLEFYVGGGGTNTAVAFSRLGLKTAYLGCLGNDDNGRKVRNELKKENIDFIGTITESRTNYSIILDTKANDRTILTYKDASEKLDFSLVDKHMLMASWYYLCAMNIKILEKISSFAKKHNICVAFNPSNYLAKKGAKSLKRVLANTNALILNEDEAHLITGGGTITSIIYKLHKLGPKFVVITRGKNGAELYYNDVLYMVEAEKTKVIETTGAGDAFGASFVAGLIRTNSVIHALKFGIVNAASVIKHMGSKNELLSLKKAQSLINKSKIKVKTVKLKK